MAAGAECDQVMDDVPSQLAARPYVMDLQVLHASAVLTPPAVSFQHLVSNHRVFFRIQFESWLLPAQARRVRSAVHNELWG